jgi:hypothetical protein
MIAYGPPDVAPRRTLYPTAVVDASQLRFTACWIAETPLPVSNCATVEVALLVKIKFALAVPLTFGVNVTVNGKDCPAAIVIGKEIPETANSLLLALADEMVTDAPVAFTLLLITLFEPTATFPKFNAVGETDSWPLAAPVPARAILRLEFAASETIAIFPLTDPAPAGA